MNRPLVLFPSVIILIISIPRAIGWVTMNRFYGVRTRKTLSDDQAWYASNRFGCWFFIVSSLVYLGIVIFAPYLIDSASLGWCVHSICFLLTL